MIEEDTLAQATAGGKFLRAELHKLADRHAAIGEVRGLGMFNAIELVRNRRTRAPLVPFAATGDDAKPMREMLRFAMERGLYLFGFSNVIRLTPPLNISREDLEFGLGVLDATLEIADRHTD